MREEQTPPSPLHAHGSRVRRRGGLDHVRTAVNAAPHPGLSAPPSRGLSRYPRRVQRERLRHPRKRPVVSLWAGTPAQAGTDSADGNRLRRRRLCRRRSRDRPRAAKRPARAASPKRVTLARRLVTRSGAFGAGFTALLWVTRPRGRSPPAGGGAVRGVSTLCPFRQLHQQDTEPETVGDLTRSHLPRGTHLCTVPLPYRVFKQHALCLY